MPRDTGDDLWTDLGLWDRGGVRFDECVLHIGTEKTGSTSLQIFLARNRDALGRAGYLVPISPGPRCEVANHEYLTTCALADHKLADDRRRAAGLESMDAVRRHRAAVLAALHAESRALPEPRNLLLSNEHCHSRLITRGEIARLREFLARFARRLRVVIYLRAQDDLAASIHDQGLRAGYADHPRLPDFARPGPVPLGFFDFAGRLDAWASVFGDDTVIPRIHDRCRTRPGGIVGDFLGVLGLDPNDFVIPGEANRSMDAACQDLLNAVNRLADARGEVLPASLRAELISWLQGISRDRRDGGAADAARAFRHRFALGNERVRERYFADDDALFAALA